eukprot:g15898.t1
MPKVAREKNKTTMRHGPLGMQIDHDDATRNLRAEPRKKPNRTKASLGDGNEDGGLDGLDQKMTKKVLDSITEQRAEEVDLDLHGAREDASYLEERELQKTELDEAEDDGKPVFVPDEEELKFLAGDSTQLSPEEEQALALFMPPSGRDVPATASTGEVEKRGTTLADMVMQKLQERNAEDAAIFGPGGGGASASSSGAAHQAAAQQNVATEANQEQHRNQLSPKVIKVYSEIGQWLKTYKSGKMPKPFLHIPSLVNWEEVLCLTNPLDWSANAMREATKIFASQLNAKMAQRFFNLVLLPAIRQDMAENKKLNFHYYESLKKAMFKPGAFMKGILLPLALESCTLREAHIICSVLGKISVPVLHASATLVRMAEFSPWYGTTAMFMAALINKKYSLPYSVIGKLVDHFYSFLEDERELPLVWHRCLLVFVQRYKGEFSEEQRLKLKQLLKVHCHECGIGQEVKRELLAIAMTLRGAAAAAAGGSSGGMDVDA